MANLLYYRNEHKLFPEAYADKVSESYAELIFDKLKAHYKFHHRVIFRGNRQRGKCSAFWITLCRNPSIGLIAHEVAHAIQLKKEGYHCEKGRRWHTKKHTAIMKRVLNYINIHIAGWIAVKEKKNERYLEMADDKFKRQQQKLAFKKTDEYKIQQLQKREKRLLSKFRRAENALKKVRKKLKYYEKKASLQSPNGDAHISGIAPILP